MEKYITGRCMDYEKHFWLCMCLCTPIYPHAFLMYIVLVLGNQITTQNEICVKNQFTTDNHE
jgi:hypothetical protein